MNNNNSTTDSTIWDCGVSIRCDFLTIGSKKQRKCRHKGRFTFSTLPSNEVTYCSFHYNRQRIEDRKKKDLENEKEKIWKLENVILLFEDKLNHQRNEIKCRDIKLRERTRELVSMSRELQERIDHIDHLYSRLDELVSHQANEITLNDFVSEEMQIRQDEIAKEFSHSVEENQQKKNQENRGNCTICTEDVYGEVYYHCSDCSSSFHNTCNKLWYQSQGKLSCVNCRSENSIKIQV